MNAIALDARRDEQGSKDERLKRSSNSPVPSFLYKFIKNGFEFLKDNKKKVALTLLSVGVAVGAYYLFQSMPNLDFGFLFSDPGGGGVSEVATNIDFSSPDSLSSAEFVLSPIDQNFKPKIIDISLGDYKLGDPILIGDETFSLEEFRNKITEIISHKESVFNINVGEGSRYSTEQALNSILKESGISYSSNAGGESPLEAIYDPDQNYFKLDGANFK